MRPNVDNQGLSPKESSLPNLGSWCACQPCFVLSHFVGPASLLGCELLEKSFSQVLSDLSSAAHTLQKTLPENFLQRPGCGSFVGRKF